MSHSNPRPKRPQERSSTDSLVLKSDLALILTDVRLARNWSKRRLAAELGVNASTLTRLESGQQFSLWERTWQRIVEPLAALLEVTPEELEPLGKELITDVEVPQSSEASEASPVLEMIARDTRLDEDGKRFVSQAYRLAVESRRPAAASG